MYQTFEMEDFVHDHLEDLEDGTDLVSRMNYAFGARCDKRTVSTELDDLLYDAKGMINALGILRESLDTVEEYGWSWPVRDEDVPDVGDAVWTERLRPKVRAFVAAYRRSATFMSRKGQRSQHVMHASLDPRSGLTEGQMRKKRYRLHERRERRRERQERAAREQAQRDADDARMRELTEELEHLRKKKALST